MSGKLKYVKPCMELIDFSLTSSIAGVCLMTPLQANDACYAMMTDNEWIVYEGGNGTCLIDTSDVPEFCYHVPTEDRSVHVS